MPSQLATRRNADVAEPVGVGVRCHSMSKSHVSRRFKEATATARVLSVT